MRTMVFLFSFFSLSQLAVATGLEISFYCDKKDQYLYKNISCCLTRISQDKCEELIDRNLKASTLLQIDSTLNSIRNDMWPWGGYPNCFWNAISYHDQDMGNNPGPLEVQQFEYYLENDYSPIGEEKLESGDMIVFDANYLYWEMGLYMKREWSQINDEPFHAVIHLGNGFAFQKESALNEVFSIDRIDFIRTQINIWIKKLSHSKDQYTTTRFYRRNF